MTTEDERAREILAERDAAKPSPIPPVEQIHDDATEILSTESELEDPGDITTVMISYKLKERELPASVIKGLIKRYQNQAKFNRNYIASLRINAYQIVEKIQEREIKLIGMQQGLKNQMLSHIDLSKQLFTAEQAAEAKRIYESGKFLEYAKKTFSQVWLGDAFILEAILYMGANIRVINALIGIHLAVLGNTQIGKSDSVSEGLKFIHPINKVIKTFSPMYLFHAKLEPNKILFSDDTTLQKEVAAIYRNMLTSWNTGVVRGTVTNNEPLDLEIPPRISLILTSVESVVDKSDEGQDESRFLIMEIRRAQDQIEAILKFIQQTRPDISNELSIIHAMWELIPTCSVEIHNKDVKPKDKITIRDFKRYLSLVQAHALLCNRTTTTDEDFTEIDKFLTNSKPMIDSMTPAYKRDEIVVLQALQGKAWRSIGAIQTDANIPLQRVYRAIRGRDGTFDRPSGGLMESVRNLKYEYDVDTKTHRFQLE